MRLYMTCLDMFDVDMLRVFVVPRLMQVKPRARPQLASTRLDQDHDLARARA